MDFSALLIVVGAGATVDTLGSIERGREPIVPLIGSAFLLIILAAFGRVTGEWRLVTALAFLFLIASVFQNFSTFTHNSGKGIVASLTKQAPPSVSPHGSQVK